VNVGNFGVKRGVLCARSPYQISHNPYVLLPHHLCSLPSPRVTNMRIPSPFQLLLSFFFIISICSAADAAAGSSLANLRTSTLYAWPLTAATPTPFAKVTYSARTQTGSYELLPNPSLDDDELVRVGVIDSDKWTGSVTRARILSRTSGVLVTIWLDAKGDVWHVEFARNESVR
jgi:hypothetical protein